MARTPVILALILPALAHPPLLLGQIDFLVLVFVVAVSLTIVAGYLRPIEDVNVVVSEAGTQGEKNSSLRSAWITIILWVSLGALDLAYSIHMYFGSFANAFFMFGDLTNNLSIIQSIATGALLSPPA